MWYLDAPEHDPDSNYPEPTGKTASLMIRILFSKLFEATQLRSHTLYRTELAASTSMSAPKIITLWRSRRPCERQFLLRIASQAQGLAAHAL